MVAIAGGSEKVQDIWSGTAEAVATYLQDTVAKTLAEGIAATIKAQPQDPPVFLSRWLLQYVEERRKQREAEDPLIRQQQGKCILQAFSTTTKVVSLKEDTPIIGSQGLPARDPRCLSSTDDHVIEEFRQVEWVEEETISKVLNHLKEKLGATGVYLAKYEEQIASKDEEATASLKYIAADDSHCYMLNNCLQEEEGLTWDLLQEDEAGKELEGMSKESIEETDGDEEELFLDEEAEDRSAPISVSGDENGKNVTQKSLLVDEVLDNPRIRFFGLTRPGSYIAVSMELSEVANTDSLMATFNWMKQKRAREEAIAASDEHEETASSASGESGTASAYLAGVDGAEGDLNEDESTLEEAHKPLAPPVLRNTRSKYVLCADSLGQEEPFDQEALQCVQFFAEQIGRTIVRTQKEAVERQAAEMLNSSEQRELGELLSELQQNCSIKLQQLQEQRQTEALQLLDEQEAQEAAEAERQRQEHEQKQQEKAAAGNLAEKTALKKEEQPEESDSPNADSLSNHAESDDGKSDEQILIPPAISRQCVLDAIAAQCALESFNDEVLTPLKDKFSISKRYIAESPRLVSAAAACALLLGYEVKPLKVNYIGKDGSWNWNRLRRFLINAFPDAMLAFDPKVPRHFKDKENGLHFITEMLDTEIQGEDDQPQQPLEILLSSWLAILSSQPPKTSYNFSQMQRLLVLLLGLQCAIRARKTELVLQKEKLKRTAIMQHSPPPELAELTELDADFECIEDGEI